MTYQEALKKANTFISNELALARPTLDEPSTLNIFIGDSGITIHILNKENWNVEIGSD